MKKYILLLFLGIAITANAQDLKLIVDRCLPEQNNWCWAASSQCILNYYGTYKYQCEIAEYVRTSEPTWHYYGPVPCCYNATYGCNQSTALGGGRGSMQDILCELGDIVSKVKRTLTPNEIRSQLEQQHPFAIMRVLLADTNVGHVMVGYGISSSGIIHDILVMDPNNPNGYVQFDYDLLHNDDKYEWRFSLTTELSRGVPCHCYNGAWDADKDELDVDCGPVCGVACSGAPGDHCKNHRHDPNLGETGIDCGGPDCPQCTLCNNCILNEGEDAMDCGGSCTPCKYVEDIADERIITNSAQLRPEVRAFNKITAGGATTVESWREVDFITEPTGSIVLLPGFTVENGAHFRTQMKDLSKYKRLCGGSICHNHHLSDAIIAPYYGLLDYLKIYNLNYAVNFGCSIYKRDGYAPNSIYNITNYKITRDGEFSLWNCLTGAGDNPKGVIWYRIDYSIDYCNNERFISSHNFYVDYTNFKSLPKDPNSPETPPQLPLNSTSLPSATSTPNFTIIPNPNPGVFQLETNFPLSDIGNLKITNMMGATVYETQNVASNTVQLPSSATGQYFIVMILKDGTVLTRKMVVQRN